MSRTPVPGPGGNPLGSAGRVPADFRADSFEGDDAAFKEGIDEFEDTDGVERTGGVATAVGHTITAVIGAGILNLPYAISILGWIAGPLTLLGAALVTLFTSNLLAECSVIRGVRQRTYTDVVLTTFGRRGYIIMGWVQHINLFVTAIAYQITGTLSLQMLARSICKTNSSVDCLDTYWVWSIVFAGAQLFVVQMPSLHHFWWASLVGAAMSFAYSCIALGLSIAEGNTYGTIAGQKLSPSAKAFGVLNSLGSVLFAYSFSMILVEIQNTIKCRPGVGVIKPMRSAVRTSVLIMTSLYMAVSVAGYMAFGSSIQPDILTRFAGPGWVLIWANAMVIIHMVPAYQVYAQPTLAFIEERYARWARAPAWSRGWKLRIPLRSFYVVAVCIIAICLPFFNDIVGLIGALGFWPTTVFFPVECWIRVYNPDKRKRFWLRVLNIACGILTLAAMVGSIQLIVVDSSGYSFFD